MSFARCAALWLTTCAGTLGAAASGQAQTRQTTPPTAQPIESAYLDRVLEEGPQPDLVPTDSADGSGWLRGWRLDYNLSSERATQQSTARSVSFSGFLDTPNHGALSLNASQSRQDMQSGLQPSRRTTRAWRIDQLALPLNRGWLANHSAGNVNSLQVPLMQGFGRNNLTSSPVQGLVGQWAQGQRWVLNASIGQPGVYDGLGDDGFELARGRLASVGVQFALPGNSATTASLGFQLNQASAVFDPANPNGTQDIWSQWSGWRWQGQAPWADAVAKGDAASGQRDGALELQLNAFASQTTRQPNTLLPQGLPASESAQGVWADAQWRSGWLSQTAGVFYLQPNLRWGVGSAISDLRGVNWRAEWSTRQWQAGLAAELADSVSGLSSASTFVNAFGRYRLTARDNLAASLALRAGSAAGQSAQFTWSRRSDWGQTQWRGEVVRAAQRRALRANLDHSWLEDTSGTLATSLGWERLQEQGLTSQAWNIGVVGGLRLWRSVSLDANLRGAQSPSGPVYNGALALTWAVARGWRASVQYSAIQGQANPALQVTSALAAAAADAIAATPNSRRLLFTLQYSDSTGSRLAPIGGAPGSGFGYVSGVVFFDADDNGLREASEAGVPDVTIRLNGRFQTRSDAQGRYEFPAVAEGSHRLEIIADNVPLPWSPKDRTAQGVQVWVRDRTIFDFALQRQR